MRTRIHGLGTLPALALLLASTAAAAATDYEVYQQLWGKYAAALSAKPKVACICLDGTHDNALGAVRMIFDDQAYCYIPSFTPEGVATIHTQCGGPFVVLGK